MASLRQNQNLFLKDVYKLLQFIWSLGLEISGGELMRTKDQQMIYMDKGLTKTMNSYHLKKLAIDLFIFKGGAWLNKKDSLQAIGDYWETLSPENRWGGNFKSFTDVFHFERAITKFTNIRSGHVTDDNKIRKIMKEEKPKFGLVKIVKTFFKGKKIKEDMTVKEGVKTSEMWVAITAAVVVFCNSYFGWSLDSEQVMQFLAPIMAYLLGRTAVKLKK